MKLSVQAYTVRDHLNQDFLGGLKRLREMDLRYVELAGFGGYSAKDLAGHLKNIGIRVSGFHQGIDWSQDIVAQAKEAAEAAKYLETNYVILPWVGQDQYRDGWDLFCQRLEPYAETVQAAGKKFLYHNHSFEFGVDRHKRPGMVTFVQSAKPGMIDFEFDLYWVKDGGEDPASFVNRFSNRVKCVHLKDMAPKGTQPPYAEAGKGTLQWDPILQACKDAKVEFGVIELDECPRDSMESVQACVQYFRAKGL